MYTSRCPHGNTVRTEVVLDSDNERTVCCGAFTSVFMDDQSLYCKCCFGAVVGEAPVTTLTFRLPPAVGTDVDRSRSANGPHTKSDFPIPENQESS